MKIINFIVLIFLLYAQSGLFAQQFYKDVTGPYLGQTPPGTTPEIFAPGIVSLGYHEHGITISPDGTEIFFVAASTDFSTHNIMFTKLSEGAWTVPDVAPFSGHYKDISPSFTPDGNRLYFASKRPLVEGGNDKRDFDIWFVDRDGDSWSEPVNAGSPINSEMNDGGPTFMQNGTMIFQSMRKQGSKGWDFYISYLKNGEYSEPEIIPAPVSTEFNEGAPFVAPDGSFLLFNSNRPQGGPIMSLFVSFKDENGNWLEPVNLDRKVKSSLYHGDYGPVLSPDGKYLFFGSFRHLETIEPKFEGHLYNMKILLGDPSPGRGTIHWVDAEILRDLK
ncbi:TolB family protein [Bacteroidota bacterium]